MDPKNLGIVVVVNKDQRWIKIEREDGSANLLWSHVNDFIDPVLPAKGDRVFFEIGENNKGIKAINVRNLSEEERSSAGQKIKIDQSKTKITDEVKQTSPHLKIVQEDEIPPIPQMCDDLNFDNHHFYTVFNPLLNHGEDRVLNGKTQAHNFYALLKSRSNGHLYWGKYKASSSNSPLNIEHFKNCLSHNKQKNQSTILYISDFQFLWAAKVEEVSDKLDKNTEGKNTLEFYRNNWDRIEIWFKITDMCLLSTETKETLEKIENLIIKKDNKLNNLPNVSGELRITPYTSNLRYPLIVDNMSFEDYFKDTQKRVIDEDQPLFDNQVESEKIKKTIHSYVIPKIIFDKIPTCAKTEIILTEMKMIDHRYKTFNERFHLTRSVACNYIRILEAVVRDLLIDKYYSNVFHKDFSIDDKGQVCNFSMGYSRKLSHSSLGTLKHLMRRDLPKLRSDKKEFHSLLASICQFIEEWNLIDIRNEGVHIQETDENIKKFEDIRRVILGVGHKGLINSLYYSFYSDEIEETFPLKNIA